MIENSAYEFRIVLVGESGVGKSSLLIRFIDDKFNDQLLSTIGVDFHFRTLDVNGEKIKLQIWDTAGQETFRSIVSAYYHSADAIVIVYDITSYSSLQKSVKDYWLKQAQQQNTNNGLIFLVGNKLDEAQNKRQVENFSIEGLLEEKIINKHFQVSAKDGTNVQSSFKQIVQTLRSRQKKTNPTKQQSDNRVKVNPGQNGSNKQCCLK